MARKKSIIDRLAGVTEEAKPSEPAVSTETKWDYKFLYAIGGPPKDWEARFDALGKEGYEFCGLCSYGRSVFKKPVG